MTPYTLGGASNAPGTSTTLQFTLGHAVADGDTLVVAAASDTLAETVTMITDSQANTYTQAASDYNQADGLAVFYCQDANPMTTSDTITATFSGSTGSHTIVGRGCNGIATAGGPDVSVTNDVGDVPDAASFVTDTSGPPAVAIPLHPRPTIVWEPVLPENVAVIVSDVVIGFASWQ